MYNLISIMFLIAAINSISYGGTEWFKILILASIGFAIAGAIGSISGRINELSNMTIKRKDLLDGGTEFIFKKNLSNIQQNESK